MKEGKVKKPRKKSSVKIGVIYFLIALAVMMAVTWAVSYFGVIWK